MSRTWTQEQKLAFSTLDGTILVSAAAGSGKTSILVERVIKAIVDEKNPIDADKLLIVTFTNAAANEMKDRISIAISKLVEENPDDLRIKRQQILFESANISTIDSFCSKLIRENFYKLSISPKFRTIDENEMLIIKQEAIDNVLEKMYSDKSNNFSLLADVFNYGRDDKKLVNTIETLYEYTRAYPFPESWLSEKLNMYENITSIENTQWGKLIFDISKQIIDITWEQMQQALKISRADKILDEKYSAALENTEILLKKLKDSIYCKQWDSVYELVSEVKYQNLGRVKKCNNMLKKEQVKLIWKSIKESIKEINKLFIASEKDCIDDINRLYPIMKQLFFTVELYNDELYRLKKEKNGLGFSDLLHFALKLLVKNDSNKLNITDFAYELRNDFDMIMVDEYQDINKAQEMLFRAISKEGTNLFMVGDVKQSIYRFRQANPQIFLNKANEFKKYNENTKEYPAKIILSKNFRSRKGILDFNNFVFSNLMSKQTGDIEYTEDEYLNFGATYYNDKKNPDVDIDIINKGGFDEDEKIIIEAKHIATKIKKLMATETTLSNGEEKPLQFSDFCILLRSTKDKIKPFKKELLDNGIPAISDTEGTFFGTTEISVITSYLRIIDNPIQDIPIISVLLSPIYGITPDELAEIRMNSKNSQMYFAIKDMAVLEGELSQKCKKFLDDIEKFRILAATNSSDKLINIILEKTAYFSIVQAMNNGNIRLLNLRMLINYAKSYESNGFKGINGFIRYIDKLRELKSDLSPASALSQKANAVRIMSIHKSKGLEFPVCIIANLENKFRNITEDIDLNEKLGVGIYLRSKENSMLRYNTLPKQAVKKQEKISSLSEELRILYVAMTRAKERLILVTALDDIRATVKKLSNEIGENDTIPPYIVSKATSMSDWIIMCALKHEDGKILREIGETDFLHLFKSKEEIKINLIYGDEEKETDKTEKEKKEKKESSKIQCNEKLINNLKDAITYKYTYETETEIPSKVSASQLTEKSNKTSLLAKPSFIDNKGLSPSEKGTALHRFMQFADYKLSKQNLELQLKYLEENGFLSKKQTQSIEIDKLKAFFNSDLYRRIENSGQVYRELLFTSLIDASLIDEKFKKEETVLQGAVDCAFIEDDKIVIVDYKTDRIRDISVLKERYKKQVELYKIALSKTLEKEVKECILYSLYLNEEIKI